MSLSVGRLKISDLREVPLFSNPVTYYYYNRVSIFSNSDGIISLKVDVFYFFTHLHSIITLDIIIYTYVSHVTSDTTCSHISHGTLKSWEWPGEEAPTKPWYRPFRPSKN